MKILMLALLISGSIFGSTVSFESIYETFETKTISPILYNGLEVEAKPIAICVLAGYQIVESFKTYSLSYKMNKDKVISRLSGAGWGFGSIGSAFTWTTGHIPANVDAKIISSVTCRRKTALPAISTK